MAGLRFAMITTFYPPYHFGGDATYVRQLCHSLVAMGHTVDVIHDRDAFRLLSNKPEPEPLAEPQGLTVHGLESRVGPLSCFLTQQTGFPIVHGHRIKRILREGQFDVIHYHNISLVGGPGVLGYGDAIKIYTAHEHWLVCPMHVLWRYNREVCEQRQCLRCSLSYRRPPQLWRGTGLIERKLRHVDALFALSHFSADKHRQFGLARPMPVLPSYIPDLPAVPVASTAEVHERPYFLFVGRLEKIKGLQDIIPVFASNSAPADLLIVGSGDFEQSLRQLAGDSPRVHFLGWKRPEQIAPLYAGAVAAVMPSICYEVFPLVVLEAFRAGTPIVARELGPFPEIIEYSKGGFLFSDREQLRVALDALANAPQLRAQMGRAGRKAFDEKWSLLPAMSEYFACIRAVAERRTIAPVLEKLADHEPVNTQLLD